MALVPSLDLDLRDEELLAAQAISRVTGSLTVERIDQEIASLRQLRTIIASGVSQPLCPELTNANPSSPHTVILEAQSWQIAQVTRRINKLPLRDQIEFVRLFGIELREAIPATALLTFTVSAPPGVNVTIPEGTEVTSADGDYVFITNEDLIVPSGTLTGAIFATRTITGKTNLSANILTELTDPIGYVTAVTNLITVDSGSDAETIDQALIRARNYQRRGERLVSSADFEDAIREEILTDGGIVRAFPFVSSADWEDKRVGETTIIVMTDEGNPVTDTIKSAISTKLSEAVGNQFIYVIDPIFVNFNISAVVRLSPLVPEAATLALIQQNLRAFYKAKYERFGEPALRSEIIAVIEGTLGVDRIVAQGAEILAAPTTDVAVTPYQMAKLVNITLTVDN